MKNTEDLRPYWTFGVPLLLLMVILMVLGIVGAVVLHFFPLL